MQAIFVEHLETFAYVNQQIEIYTTLSIWLRLRATNSLLTIARLCTEVLMWPTNFVIPTRPRWSWILFLIDLF